jgi:hypothetical protein
MRRRQAVWGPRPVSDRLGLEGERAASEGQGARPREGARGGRLPALVLSSGLLLMGAATGLFSSGCFSDEAPKAEPPDDLQKYMVDKVPEKATVLNVNFDDKVTLAAVEIEPGLDVTPGKRVKVTMYWKVDKALDDPEWKLFTHVLDGSGDRLMNIDNVGPLRHLKRNGQTWPPGSWEAGKIYVDSQSFTMPRKVKSSKVQIVTGIWKGRERLPIKAGPVLTENRALVATLTTSGKAEAKSGKVPELEISRLEKAQSIKLDGKLDEAAWQTAADTAAFVNVRTGEPEPESPVQGSAKLLWDDKYLYLGFDVKDEDISGGFDKGAQDPHLWTKDCVEIMLDPDGNGDNKNYYEIQVNPQNLMFDSQYDDYNRPRKDPDGPFGHQDWSSKLESAVRLDGTLDNSKDKDKGYVVELRIPWTSLSLAKASPPKPGDTWRLNLYAMQNNDGVAWSPILDQGNFHKASRFGKVTWAEAGKPSAAADGPVVPASSTTLPKRPEVETTTTRGGGLIVTKKSLQTAPQTTVVPPPAPPAPSPAPVAPPYPTEPYLPPPGSPPAPPSSANTVPASPPSTPAPPAPAR